MGKAKNIILALIVAILVIGFILLMYDSVPEENTNIKQNKTQNSTPVDNEVEKAEVAQEPLTITDEEIAAETKAGFLEQLNNQRVDYNLPSFEENEKLTALLEEYLKVWQSNNEKRAQNEIGTLKERFENLNIQTAKKLSYSEKFEIYNGDASVTIYDDLVYPNNQVNSNFFLPEYTQLGMAVMKVNDTYYVILDFYSEKEN
jgi:hypothetical protein